MGKAIAIVSLILVCSFGFVFYSLWTRRQPAGRVADGPAPLLETRPDGSTYAVSRQLDAFERRLMDEERRWVRLNTDLDAIRKERDDLAKQVDDLQGEVRRLRKLVTERPARPPAGNAPAGNSPDGSIPPVTPPTGDNP